MASPTAAYTRAAYELVLANHVLAMEDVLDAMGHVSVRNPDDPSSFLLSRSRSPEFVDEDDIFVHDFKGDAAGVAEPDLYRERFIHAAIYESRPDVHAVVHSHAHDVLPFSVSSVPLRAIVHDASSIGVDPVPVWDSRDEFGDTRLLVANVDQGRSLVRKLGGRTVVLMRGQDSHQRAQDGNVLTAQCPGVDGRSPARGHRNGALAGRGGFARSDRSALAGRTAPMGVLVP
jgi:hypothetical protein